MMRWRSVLAGCGVVCGLLSTARADLSRVYPAQPVKGMQLAFRVQGYSARQVTEQGDNLDPKKNPNEQPPSTMYQRVTGTADATTITVEGQLLLTAPGEYSYGIYLKTDLLNPTNNNRPDNHREAQDNGRFKGPGKRSFKVSLPLLSGQQYLTWEVSLSGPLNNQNHGIVRVAGLADTSSAGAPATKPTTKLYRIRQLYVEHFRDNPSPFAGRVGHPGIWAGLCGLAMPADFDEWACGSYQRKVLALFDSFRFSQSPELSELMTDFDYGPIQALGGGHQAVVLWQKGQTWTSDGLVFDPWITQTPEVYAMEDWALQFSGGSYHGVGPSKLYNDAPYYPTHGGRYVPPTMQLPTPEEKKWVESLPEAQRNRIYQHPSWPSHIRNAYVREQYQKRLLSRVFQAHCPLEIALVDAQGRLTGYRNGQPLMQIPGVWLTRFPTSDGGYWTKLEFPGNQTYRLVAQGTGSGRANLLAAYGVNQDGKTPVLQQYTINVAAGTRVEFAAVTPNALCRVSGQTVNPQPFAPDNAKDWSGLKRPKIWLPPSEADLSITPRTPPTPAPSQPPGNTSQATLEGKWAANFNGFEGTVTFTRRGTGWVGELDLGGPEPLTKIKYDAAKGTVSFERASCDQVYTGQLRGDRMGGQFTQSGSGGMAWTATRAKGTAAPPANPPAPATRPPAAQPPAASRPSGPARYFFDNRNGGGVRNGPPPQKTTFTLGQTIKLEQLRTYHWNEGKGAAPGTITLEGPGGKRYGPWQAKGIDDPAGRKNLYWEVLPNVMLPKGTYTIVDSGASTWSHNAQSSNAGIALVWGTPY